MIDFSTLEKKCPVCGKIFIARKEWAFKRYDKDYKWPKYICSWSCCKKYDEKYKQKERQRHFARRVD